MNLRRLDAVLVIGLGAAAGVPLAAWLGGVMTGFLRDRGVVPADFAPPAGAAALAGVLVTQVAVLASARRAARTRATEALQQAAGQRRPVIRARLVAGLAILVFALLLAAVSASAGGQTRPGRRSGSRCCCW